MNKLYCYVHQVTPKHVSEAFNLLNKSIIRVEQPDVNLDDDMDDDLNQIHEPNGNSIVYTYVFFYSYYFFVYYLGMDVDPTDGPEQQGLTKKKLTLAFEDYKRITNMLVVYMRSEEEKRMAGMDLIFIFQ